MNAGVKRATRSAIAAATLMLAGCVGYNTYPPQGGALAGTDPNARTMQAVMVAAIQDAVRTQPPPPDSPYAIGLPRGATSETYQRVTSQVGDRARPLTTQTRDLPIYLVGRVWIRGPKAEVDIHRPLDPSSDTVDRTQATTFYLRGGFKDWHVIHRQAWAAGAVPVPPFDVLEPTPAPPPIDTASVNDPEGG